MSRVFNLRTIILFTLFLIGFKQKCFAQCKNDLFNTTYIQQGGRTFSEMVALPSNSIILGGSTSQGLNLIKINPNGDTVFSKFILPISQQTPGTSARTTLFYNNTLLNIQLGTLIHTDTNANVLTTKQLHIDAPGGGGLNLNRVCALPDGDFIILANNDSGYILARASGNFKTIHWSKFIKMQITSAFSIILDGDKVIVVGGYTNSVSSPFYTPYIASFDIVYGNLIRSTGFDGIPGYSTRINQIIKTGDNYIAEISHFKNNFFDPTDLKYFLRLDTAFNIISAKRLLSIRTDLNTALPSTYQLLADFDGAYYINSSANASFTPLIITRVGFEDDIKWNTNIISIPIGFGDIKATNEGLIVSSVSVYNNVQTNKTETSLAFAKVGFNGIGLNCFSTIQINNVLKDTTYSRKNLPSVHEIRDYGVVWVDVNYSTPTIPTTLSRKCISSNSCNSIDLIGTLKVCNSNPITYTGRRNTGCFNRVDWEISPKTGIKSSILTDSTISLKFIESGRYMVVAKLLTSCGILSDTIYVDASLSNVNLGNDTTLCPGQILKLETGGLFDSYNWQDGSNNSFYNATQPGKYWVTVNNNACNITYSDTILIDRGKEYQFPARNKTEICIGQTAELISETGFKTYQWSPNYNITNLNTFKTTVNPTTDTLYTVLLTDAQGCSGVDSFRIRVNSYPDFLFPPDTLLCDNNTLHINVDQSNPAATYLWQNGSTSSNFLVSQPGNYQVTVNINGCSTSKKNVISYNLSPSVNLGKDSVKCNEDVIVFDISFPNASYLWQDGKTSPFYQIQNAGIYFCSVETGCGVARDTIIIKNEVCECLVDAPNVFSPNGDGIHDIFNVFTKCRPVEFLLQIFNRNGQVIFTSNTLAIGWDGKYQNKPAPIGTYYYLIKIRGASEGVARQKSGGITLIR